MATTKSHEQLLETIGNMTVLELAELVKGLEEKFGVSAASMAVAAPAAQGVAQAAEKPKEEEKSEYKVELLDAGPEKIKTIKAFRSVTINGVAPGLGDAKAKVEGAPSVLYDAVPKDIAMQLKKELEAVGAKVKLS